MISKDEILKLAKKWYREWEKNGTTEDYDEYVIRRAFEYKEKHKL